MRNSYRDGLPLHVHPKAHEESAFHLVTEAAFEDLSDRQVQTILRRRHIVVHGCRHKETTFKQALHSLGGGPESRVEIQGIYPYSVTDSTG